MKTNRTSIRRLAILAGTFVMMSQAAQAEVAKPAPQGVSQAQTVSADQARVLLASTSCTRVGSRMVC